MEVNGQLHVLGTHLLRGCVHPRANLDMARKRKISAPTENLTVVVQAVASYDTN